MEKIQHSRLPIRGLNLHVAHAGEGTLGTVFFLHGFPEIWYSWRHQILAAAEAGFKAVAPDFRGYGLSDQPADPESTTWDDLTADLLAIFDCFSISKAFIVAKDFGAMSGHKFAIRHPERVLGVVSLGIPFSPMDSSVDLLPEGFYIRRWREPGRAEADFGRFDVKRIVRTIYILFSRSELPIAQEGQEIMDLADSNTPLPQWFTEEDLNVYAALYENSGFMFPLHLPYRSLHLTALSADSKIEVPTLLIMGEKDYAFDFPGTDYYIRSGMIKNFVPDLEINYIPEGCHFAQEQFPDQVNQLIITFLQKHI